MKWQQPRFPVLVFRLLVLIKLLIPQHLRPAYIGIVVLMLLGVQYVRVPADRDIMMHQTTRYFRLPPAPALGAGPSTVKA